MRWWGHGLEVDVRLWGHGLEVDLRWWEKGIEDVVRKNESSLDFFLSWKKVEKGFERV